MTVEDAIKHLSQKITLAIEYGDSYAFSVNVEALEIAVKALKNGQKKGKWNWVGFNIECSECGAMPDFDSTEPLYNFCPNCGADMRGERNDE